MVKKKAADKVESKVVAKCDNIYEVTYSQSDIERMIITNQRGASYDRS